MISNEFLNKANHFFPDLKIKFKDENFLMKIIGFLLFFNKKFMTDFTTTIGSTIYFPNKKFLNLRPISALIIIIHEMVHISDSKKYSKFLFSFLYLFPQILILFSLPMLFLSWKISLFFLIFALPLPAYFRMYFEKRAYLVSLYCVYKLSIKKNFSVNLNEYSKEYLSVFKGSQYYFMWVFSNLDKCFSDALNKINSGNRPYNDSVFEMVDKMIDAC